MRFPRQHHLGQYLIHERFRLPTTPFPMTDEDTFIHLNGRKRAPQRIHARHVRLRPGARRARAGAGGPDAAGDGATHRDRSASRVGWAELVARYDRYSLLGYLIERGVSEGARALMGPLLNLEGRFHFSLVEWFAHYHEDVFGDLEYIDGGADTLAASFAPMLLDDTRLGSEVHAIEQDADGVVVRYQTEVGGEGEVAGDECIVTVPFVLLRHMEIGGLDVAKRFNLRNVYYGRAHKIFMQFSRRWWVEDEHITHGVTVTDLAIRNIVYTPAGQNPDIQRGVLIASYAWEQDSMAYSMLTEHQRIAQAMEDLAKIHPQARDTFEFGISHDWALDAYAGGIGPLFRPFEMSSEAYDDVIRPVDRLWFANDACDQRGRRWIKGAISAAVKNAFAIHTGMRNELPVAPEA